MKEFINFNLKEETSKKGTKTFGYVPFATKIDGTWLMIPVMLAIGKEDGPVILADGCNHGDEYEGTEGIIAAFHALDVDKMKGSFVGVPALNMPAFAAMRRYSEMDFVPQDLNRIYPGSPNGPVTQSIAHYYLNEFVKNADALITIHGGGNYLYLEPITLYQNYGDERSKKSREMAEAFGFDALWSNNICVESNGILDEIAYLNGVPAITPEIGGQTTRATCREENVEHVKNGIINVLKLWNVLSGDIQKNVAQYHVDVNYLYCKNGGIHKPQKRGKEKVKKGEVLSIITNIFGEEVDRVLAPFDGIVIGYWAYSVIHPRSWAYMLGKEL